MSVNFVGADTSDRSGTPGQCDQEENVSAVRRHPHGRKSGQVRARVAANTRGPERARGSPMVGSATALRNVRTAWHPLSMVGPRDATLDGWPQGILGAAHSLRKRRSRIFASQCSYWS